MSISILTCAKYLCESFHVDAQLYLAGGCPNKFTATTRYNTKILSTYSLIKYNLYCSDYYIKHWCKRGIYWY